MTEQASPPNSKSDMFSNLLIIPERNKSKINPGNLLSHSYFQYSSKYHF
jgi:hypothetical protein